MVNSRRNKDRSATLLRVIGEVIVRWSQIESIWARIFQRLLFDRMKEPLVPGLYADTDTSPRMERALAIWDSMPSSTARMDMVEAVAKVVLRNRQIDLARLKEALDETNSKRGLRNAFAHAHFERENENPTIGKVWTGPGRLVVADRARTSLCGKDPRAEAPKVLAQLDALKLKVGEVRVSLMLPGYFDELPPFGDSR